LRMTNRISGRPRLLAGLIFLLGLGTAGLLHWAAINDLINIDRLVGPCGLKQKYGLPCPSCGMTTALIAFAKGQILEAFYIQPAAAVLYSLAVLALLFSLVIAVLGTDFGLLRWLSERLKLRYIIIALLILVAGGWAVTLARALACETP
jgi:hypothetical protein